MKAHVVKKILLLVILGLFIACNSSDDDTDFEMKDFRVKEILITAMGDSNIEEDKTILYYEEEKLSEAIGFQIIEGAWVAGYKSMFHYEGEWVSVKNFTKNNDDWEEMVGSTTRYKIVNNRVVEIENWYGTGTSRVLYNYSNDKLISIQEISNNELRYKREFTYTGNELKEMMEYYSEEGKLNPMWKDEFSYLNGNLNTVTGYYLEEGNWKIARKFEYTYSAGKLAQVAQLYWNENEWNLEDTSSFKYNADGLLVSVKDAYNDNYSVEMQYTYEKGLGNLKVFMDDNHYRYYYPTPQKMRTKKRATKILF